MLYYGYLYVHGQHIIPKPIRGINNGQKAQQREKHATLRGALLRRRTTSRVPTCMINIMYRIVWCIADEASCSLPHHLTPLS